MVGYVALAITAVIIVSICARIDNWHRDLSTHFAETEASAGDPDLRPLTLHRSRSGLAAGIQEWAESETAWMVVSTETEENFTVMHLTRTTPVFRFVDDVHVTITDEYPPGSIDDAWSIVTATSRSRFGKGDLGQNPRNLKRLARAIRAL